MTRTTARRPTASRTASGLTPDDILAVHDPRVVTLALRLRAIVRAAMPEANERAYPVWRGIGYVHCEAGYVCAIFPQRDHVLLGFEHGASLPDREGLLQPGRTGGRQVRYVHVRNAGHIRVRALRALIASAVALRSPAGANVNAQPPRRRAARARRSP